MALFKLEIVLEHPTHDPLRPRPTDNAVFRDHILGSDTEPTYGGVLSFMRRKLSRDLNGVDVVVWGIPFDSGTSNRPGARFGPRAVRRASVIFDGYPQYPFHADPYEQMAVIDYGDCSFDFGYVADVPEMIENQAAAIINAGPLLVSLGGDHFVTLPLLRAHAKKYGPMALVHFDAHQDTWAAKPGRIDHGPFVVRARDEGLILPDQSIQIGIRTHAPEDCDIEIIYGDEMETLRPADLVSRIRQRVGSAKTYITFDIDCLDPAFAPGTGTPVSGGLTPREALTVLKHLSPLDIVGCDLVEVAPAYDHADITAIAGSTVVRYYMGILAERKLAGTLAG